MTDWTRGYTHVYTGDGKGKTTAALGLALRAAGAGLPVFIGQFVKGMAYSELEALKRFDDLIAVRQFGLRCFVTEGPTDDDLCAARRGLEESREALTGGRYRVVILDEAGVAVHLKLFGVEEVIALIDARPENVELIVTGRRTPQPIIDRADLVTEMREVKHYYNVGVEGRVGIEK